VTADEPNLIGTAGWLPMLELTDQLGLPGLVSEHVYLPPTGIDGAAANAPPEALSLIAAMSAGADSIEDIDVIRHGGMPLVFDQMRAATTIERRLRAYRFGMSQTHHWDPTNQDQLHTNRRVQAQIRFAAVGDRHLGELGQRRDNTVASCG